MPVIDVAKNNQTMTDCWYPDFLNRGLAVIPLADQQRAEAWIHTNIFNAALATPTKRMNVTEAIRLVMPHPPSWRKSALEPLYDNTYINQHEERASWLYGNYVCRIGVRQRLETWWVFKKTVGADNRSSSTYVIGGLI
jgi:hypothetical protein